MRQPNGVQIANSRDFFFFFSFSDLQLLRCDWFHAALKVSFSLLCALVFHLVTSLCPLQVPYCVYVEILCNLFFPFTCSLFYLRRGSLPPLRVEWFGYFKLLCSLFIPSCVPYYTYDELLRSVFFFLLRVDCYVDVELLCNLLLPLMCSFASPTLNSFAISCSSSLCSLFFHSQV